MKNIRPSPFLIALVSFSLLTLFSACSRKIGFENSTIAPAARGSVKVDKDNNNNYQISLDVKMLAEPNRLAQPKAVYVVWMETEQNGTQNLGQLKTDDGLFSSTLKASLKTTTPYKPRRIFITGEDNATVQTPSSFVVLNTNSF
ncbi:MAG TPA: hypothetical protein VM871_07830 [Flavisolibacter sp.]|jgi:hypothetical protein|nr:hypothetical protein [Flavisolibacter sp.]